MSKKKKVFLIIGIPIITFIFMYFGAYMLAPGSYARAEYYIVDIPQNKITSEIGIFKNEHPEYKLIQELPKVGQTEYPDKQNIFYIYFPSIDKTAICVIKRSDSQLKSLIGLVSFNDGTFFREWKRINTSDLTNSENKKLKEEFETKILDKLGNWEYKKSSIERFLGL